jgi:hypothetical protein
MNIGSLYLVKKWSWLLFLTKETAADATAADAPVADSAAEPYEAAVRSYAAWYSKRFNCDVSYFPLGSYIVFLEEDGKLKKVLTSDGLVGWTWFTESYNDYFEEVKTEE